MSTLRPGHFPRHAPRPVTFVIAVLLAASTLGTVGCGSNRARPDHTSLHTAPKPVQRPSKVSSVPSPLPPASGSNQTIRIKNDSVL